MKFKTKKRTLIGKNVKENPRLFWRYVNGLVSSLFFLYIFILVMVPKLAEFSVANYGGEMSSLISGHELFFLGQI